MTYYYESFRQLIASSPSKQSVHVDGDLSLSNLRTPLEMPEELTVQGYFSCDNSLAMIALPRRLQTGSFLSVYGCTGLEALPAELMVGDELVGGKIVLRASSVALIPRTAQIQDHELILGTDQRVLVPDSSWTTCHNKGEVVDGSKLTEETYLQLAADPQLCRFALHNSFFRQQILDGDLDFAFLQKIHSDTVKPRKVRLL